MKKRRTIAGLCMLCVLFGSALAAQGASAITGTTTFTCVKGAGDKSLRGEHCLTEGNAAKEYGHVAIAQDKTTELITSNAKTEAETSAASVIRLRTTIAGIPVELSATGLGGSGSVENKLAASGEHYTHNEGTITFTGVEVTQPSGRGCKVTTHKEDGSGNEEGEVGVVHTRALTGTTLEQGDYFKFQAADGGNFVNFFLTCDASKALPAIEGTWSCSGSFKAVPQGATSTFNHTVTTAENTLKCRGTKAGLDGKLTLSAREKEGGGSYTPVSATTVTT